MSSPQADPHRRELGYAALFDPRDLFNEQGRLLPLHLMPEHARRAVKSVKIKGVKDRRRRRSGRDR